MSARRAFTLVELLCALTLLAIVGTTIGRLLIGQQRFYASVGERLAMRSQLRDGADVLTIALRHAALQQTPIVAATDTAVELSSVIGAGTVCGVSGAEVDLAPEAPASGIALTTLAVTLDTADEVIAYITGGAPSSSGWARARIVGVATHPASAVCATSQLLGAIDRVSARATGITVAPPLAVAPGTPVRILRHVRIDGYRASDGMIYVGYRRCGAGCNSVQPVSGPYGVNVRDVEFRYFDVTGAALPAPVSGVALSRITRIDVVLRAASRGAVDLPGLGRAVAHDSTLVSIGLRNAP